MITHYLLISLQLIAVSGQGDEQILESEVSSSDFPSVAEQQEALDIHNSLRRSSKAAGMQFLKWNHELAAKAIELSQTCVFDHGMNSWQGSPYPIVGQNLFLGSNFTYTSVVQAWFDEISEYDFETNSCSHVCGHYTQTVWDDSKEVGCGSHLCNKALNPRNPNDNTTVDRYYENVHIVTCNYGPPGNFPRRPFEVGPPCTACSGGRSFCNDGLCDVDCEGSDCTCEAECVHGELIESECRCACDDGWSGHQCDEICKDAHHFCGTDPGWSEDQCEEFSVDHYCPALCGKCVRDIPDDCRDHHEFCGVEDKWSESACETSQYVRDYCPMMCETCT